MDVKQTPGSSDPEMETDDRGPDFARGQRELAKDPTAHPDFARGERSEETDEEGPDFARGQRELAKDPTAHPDFARGQDRETPRVSPEDVEG